MRTLPDMRGLGPKGMGSNAQRGVEPCTEDELRTEADELFGGSLHALGAWLRRRSLRTGFAPWQREHMRRCAAKLDEILPTKPSRP